MFKKHFSFRKKQKNLDIDSDNSLDHDRRVSAISADVASHSNFTTITNSLSADSVSDHHHHDRHSSVSDASSLGLQVVYRPIGERNCDIIFVHGLGGDSRRTWMKNRDPETFWPSKFLPQEPHLKQARISSYGYSASVSSGGGKSNMSFREFAKQLSDALKHWEDDGDSSNSTAARMGEKPIIFVAHSLGGLVVKEAYLQGSHDAVLADVMKGVSSMIFLATPHRGSNLLSFLNRVFQTSSSSGGSEKLLSDLAARSQSLQKLNEEFRHAAPRLHLISFYETRPSTVYGKSIRVLDIDSSVLGYPGETCTPLNTDHHNICKYETRQDPSYVAVRNSIKYIISKVIRKRKTPADFTWAPDPPTADLEFFKARWTEGTCSWMLGHPSYTAWLNDKSSRPHILWVNGKPATGKSITASFIIDHLASDLEKHCQYFFFRFEDKSKRSLTTMLRSLSFQLAQRSEEYAERLRQLENVAPSLKFADYRTVWRWLFQQSLFSWDPEEPIYWVLDGLDEADHYEVFLRSLLERSLGHFPLRLIILSRPLARLSVAFNKLQSEDFLKVDSVSVEGNQDDIRRYIHENLDTQGEEGYEKEVSDKIVQGSQGNFLWVHLTVQRINRCGTKYAVQQALGDLPAGMQDLYDRMAEEIKNPEKIGHHTAGMEILGLVCCAQRQLTVKELSSVLGDRVHDLLETIVDICGGFIVVDKSERITLIHETAREYLTLPSSKPDVAKPIMIDLRSTHDYICKRCLEALMNPKVGLQLRANAQVQVPEFMHYAAQSWFYHFFKGHATDVEIIRSVMGFLGSQYVLVWIHVVASSGELRPLVSASSYLSQVASRVQKLGYDESSDHRQALSTFLAWSTDLVKIVGKFGLNLVQRPNSIYTLIPPFCPESSVMYEQFGKRETNSLKISGLSQSTWDDHLASLSLREGLHASSILTIGNRIIILANSGNKGHLFVFNSVTFVEENYAIHPGIVLLIQVDKKSPRLVSYGYTETRIWDLTTCDCIRIINSPDEIDTPHSLIFSQQENELILGADTRALYHLDLDNEESTWNLNEQISEQTLDGYNANAPTCISFSPDGTMVAFGYRRHPTTVWMLNDDVQIGHCSIGSNAEATRRTGIAYQSEVVDIIWHPYNLELFGLCREGLVFRWDPYEQEPSCTVQASAALFSLSPDGSLLATGDVVGNIKVFSSADLSLLYQLSSLGSVLGIVFSFDSRRLYDIRGEYGNIWEPNTLVRLAESPDPLDTTSDSLAETESLAKYSVHTDNYSRRPLDIATLAPQPSGGSLYCYGTTEGLIILCQVGHDQPIASERVPNGIAIESVCWSEKGDFIAAADNSRRITIKKVQMNQATRAWELQPGFSVRIPSKHGNIDQMFFHPSGNHIFVFVSAFVYHIDIKVGETTKHELPGGIPLLTWTCHTKYPQYLLGFNDTAVFVVVWGEMKLATTRKYCPSLLDEPRTPTSGHPDSVKDFSSCKRPLICVLSKLNSADIVVQIPKNTATRSSKMDYLRLSISDIVPDSDNPEHPTSDLTYTVIPKDISKTISVPLALLSQNRLLFVNRQNWICSWAPDAPPTRRASGSKGAAIEENGIVSHYFLPRDWVSPNNLRLCTAMPDGTVICPKNGEVAAVKSKRKIGI